MASASAGDVVGRGLIHLPPRNWAQFLGGKWISPRPTTSPALALAIAHVWITEELYDKDYVAARTKGFNAWRDYILGTEDGVEKSPEWQELETGVLAKDVRALARKWGSKRTYLAVGGMGNTFGGACRNTNGTQWTRTMVCLMGMQGPLHSHETYHRPRPLSAIGITARTPKRVAHASDRQIGPLATPFTRQRPHILSQNACF